MDESQNTDTHRNAAAYVSWGTFKNSVLDGVAQELPNVVDRSVFPSLSGGVQAQLLSGLRFLGLMDSASKPTEAFASLAVTDEATQREALSKILSQSYSELFSLGLDAATPKQLDEAMTKFYGVTGDTRGKAVRFFLAAAKHAGVDLSSHLQGIKTRTRSKNGTSKKRSKASAKGQSEAQQTPTQAPLDSPPAGTAMTIELESGGTLTVAASVDMFRLSPKDREFVFGLIDSLQSYGTTD